VKFCINLKEITVVPVLSPDKKENNSIFSTSAQFIFFLLNSTHSNQPKKSKFSHVIQSMLSNTKTGILLVFFLKSISYVILTKFGSVNEQ